MRTQLFETFTVECFTSSDFSRDIYRHLNGHVGIESINYFTHLVKPRRRNSAAMFD